MYTPADSEAGHIVAYKQVVSQASNMFYIDLEALTAEYDSCCEVTVCKRNLREKRESVSVRNTG